MSFFELIRGCDDSRATLVVPVMVAEHYAGLEPRRASGRVLGVPAVH